MSPLSSPRRRHFAWLGGCVLVTCSMAAGLAAAGAPAVGTLSTISDTVGGGRSAVAQSQSVPPENLESATPTETQALSLFQTVLDTDYVTSAIGMRDVGTGNLSVTGVTGTVTKALLYWHGPTNSSSPTANANVLLNAHPVVGTNIGFASDDFWSLPNSQAYRADVTSWVTGNGSYALSGFQNAVAAINGASLWVFFNDGNPTNNRNVVLFNGNDSNFVSTFDAAGWDLTISGINYTSGRANLRTYVSDGQNFSSSDDGTLRVNGTAIATGGIFQGLAPKAPGAGVANGSLTDIINFDITSRLVTGQNSVRLTLDAGFSDAVSLVVAAIDLPARSWSSPGSDYDLDGKADLALFRPSSGYWYISQSGTNYGTFGAYPWGGSTDVPVAGDYDGDGKADLALYRPSTGYWYVLLSRTNYSTSLALPWGIAGDVPLPGDYDGDGKTDLGVYRPSTGIWYLLLSSTNYSTFAALKWGIAGDVPVTGDYDGDGKTDLGVYRPSTGYWYVLLSSSNYSTSLAVAWGIAGDIPVADDYDGDGKADLALYRPSTGYWYVLRSSTNFTSYLAQAWGVAGDIPVTGDYDGDGKADLALYRASTGIWWVLQSSTGYTTYIARAWGSAGDVPVLGRR